MAPWIRRAVDLDAAYTSQETGPAFRRADVHAARQEPRRNASGLSVREIEVLRLIARGANNQEIAMQLVLSEHTIHRHVANILEKLQLSSRSAAVAEAIRRGWL